VAARAGENVEIGSRAAGVLCLLAGTGLTVWAWRSALTDGSYALKAAMVGPTILVLGIGFLVHGEGIPTSGITRLSRIYGVAGGLATIANLYLLGFFQRPVKHRSVWMMETALPFLLLGVWALPARVFGGDPTRRPIARPDPPDLPAPPPPIEPR
jgi:hypothetical protein